MTRSKQILASSLEIAVPIGIVIVWAATTATAHSFVFPSLIVILQRFEELWIFARIPTDVLPSLARLAAGYGIAMVLAIAIGVPLGLSRTAQRAAAPIVEFFRSIPSPALIPFAITVFGVGSGMKVFIIAFVCIWPTLLNTIDGVRSLDPTMGETARMYRISGWLKLRHIVLPNALPQIFAGMRSSLSLALILMVISEMVASSEGIGFFILQSQRSFAIADMWAGILLLGLLGYALNAIFSLIESRVLDWHKKSRASG
ncbi:ABC transporter permease [Mesorhizobium sp. SP-1A]|uniref:ABC transporter permease n=1 Tax=Mesorhizobium sp. SP-1A TaxID=3077840 RepID=UPI0028F715F7|nr:ABC transporter permease [Mesorhizobium sp. SP-1A]